MPSTLLSGVAIFGNLLKWLKLGGQRFTCLLIIMFLNRLPMYSEAKLAFIVYLWYPKTRVWCSVLFYFWNLLFSILFVILSCSQGTAYAYRVLFNFSHIHILLPWFVCNKVLFSGDCLCVWVLFNLSHIHILFLRFVCNKVLFSGDCLCVWVLFNLSHIHILLPWFVCNKVLFQGTAYVYESFFKPYIAKHETEIDRNLLELRTRAGDMTVLYFQKVANYVQTRSYEILQYIASQSQSPTPRPQVLFSCLPFVSGIIIILASRIVTHDI
jgi:hypothetical protein